MDAKAFVAALADTKGPEQLEQLRAEIIQEENRFRELFAQAREDWDVPELDDPYQSLVPVFDTQEAQPECFQYRDPPNLPLVFKQELPEWKQELPAVTDRATFKHQFDLFTEGMLRGLNWDNVFCAGGCVGGCLMPIPPEHNKRPRDRRSYLHDKAFPGSDVDLFFWGLSEEEANKKVVEIYNTVADNCLFDVLCFRSAYAISIVSQYPFRHVQIVLRLYSSPFEVLAGFDVDSCSIGYNGNDVMMTPRAHMAMITRTNAIDMTRRSPTYELRLEKYSKRGFQVAVPGLIRERIDPMIYEQDFSKVFGLKRLLVLEKLGTAEARAWYKEMVRVKRGREITKPFRRTDRWMNARMTDLPGGGVEASDYSTVFLPWGPDWNAAKCSILMQKKEGLLNNEYANGFRGYPLHPCFIGTAEEVLSDLYPTEQALPAHADPELTKHHVRGPVSWLKDNPGRQMIGSFNPITNGDWMEGAMLSAYANELIAIACTGDVVKLGTFLGRNHNIDLNVRDKYGRTALLVTALVGAPECAQLCLDHGATIDQRLPDGRNIFHIAAAYGWETIIQFGISVAGDRLATLINSVDDRSMTPLYWAVALGQLDSTTLLVDAGAQASISPQVPVSTTFNTQVAATEVQDEHLHPFLLAMHLPGLSEELTRNIVKQLVRAGAKITDLTRSASCIFHQLGAATQFEHTRVFLGIIFEADPSCQEFGEVLMNTLNDDGCTPLSSALRFSNFAIAQTFVEHGASMKLTQEIIDRGSRLQSSKALAGEAVNRQWAKLLHNPWHYFFKQLFQIFFHAPRVSSRNDHVLMAAVNFLRYLTEHGDDPNPELSRHDVVRVDFRGQSITLAEALKVYGQSTPTQQKEQGLDDVLKQLKALKRLAIESSNESTYQQYYQRQMAHHGMQVSVVEAAEIIRRQRAHNDKSVKAKREAFDAFQALVGELLKKYPNSRTFPAIKSQPTRSSSRVISHQTQDMDINNLTTVVRARCHKEAEQEIRYIPPDVKTFEHNVYSSCEMLSSDVQAKYTSLFEAAYLGDTERVHQLCQNSISATPELLMNVCNPLCQTPFSLAVLRGHTDTAAIIFETATQQYDSFRKLQELTKLDAAKVLQNQLTNEAVASGLSNTHRLLAKVDNYALAGMHTAGADSDEEGAAAGGTSVVASSRTVRSLRQGINITASESNAIAQTPPDVLLRVKATVPVADRLSDLAYASQHDFWLQSLNGILTNPDELFGTFTTDDLMSLVASAPKNGSSSMNIAVLSLNPVAMCIWQNHQELLLQILQWSKELVHQDMARAFPAMVPPNESSNIPLFYSKHDELSFASELFSPDVTIRLLMLSDNVELFEILTKEIGLMYPFHNLLNKFGGILQTDLYLDVLKEHFQRLYPLHTGTTDALTNAFEVTLVSSTGSKHTLEISTDQTIRQLKTIIQARHAYQATHQRLFHDGIQLEDERTVGWYENIKAGAQFHLVIRLSETSPVAPTIDLFTLLRSAILYNAGRILESLVSGRVTALFDEYLSSNSANAANFHAKLGRKCQEMMPAYIAADPVHQSILETLSDEKIAQIILDRNEHKTVTGSQLGAMLFQDWFFGENPSVILDCISRRDLPSLQKLHAAVNTETWLALLNGQQHSAFSNLIHVALMTRFHDEDTKPLQDMITWLFENGMQILSPLKIKVGRLPFDHSISAALSVVKSIAESKTNAPSSFTDVGHAQLVLGYRAVTLRFLFSGLNQTVFETIINHTPRKAMEEFVTLFTLYNDGSHPLHLLISVDKQFAGNLDYWLQCGIMDGLDVAQLVDLQGRTAFHVAVDKQSPLALARLFGTDPAQVCTTAISSLDNTATVQGTTTSLEDVHGNTAVDKAINSCINTVNTTAQALHSVNNASKIAFSSTVFEAYLQCMTSMKLSARVPSTATRSIEQLATKAHHGTNRSAFLLQSYLLPSNMYRRNLSSIMHASNKSSSTNMFTRFFSGYS